VIDASAFSIIAGIVRVNDRRAKVTISEPDKTATHKARIVVNASDVARVIDLLREGRISGSRIIKSRDDSDRDSLRCLLSKREAGQGEYCEHRIDNIACRFHVFISSLFWPSLVPHSEKPISGRSQVYCPKFDPRLRGKLAWPR